MCDIVCCFRFLKCYFVIHVHVYFITRCSSYSFSVFLELLVRVYRLVEYTVMKMINSHYYNAISSQYLTFSFLCLSVLIYLHECCFIPPPSDVTDSLKNGRAVFESNLKRMCEADQLFYKQVPIIIAASRCLILIANFL